MPRPPVLPLIDWKQVLESSCGFDAWITAAESPEQANRMLDSVQRQELEPAVVEALGKLSRVVHVLAFAEDWCGDVVRHVPVLEKMARATPKLQVRYCTREEQPGAFVRFLTNGGEAVPKFVFFSEQYVECANWGPMPDALRDVISRGKACGDVKAAREITRAGYEEDRTRREVVRELLGRIEIAAAERP